MVAAAGVSFELLCGLEGIGAAKELAAGGVFDGCRKLAALLFQQAFNAFVTPFVVGAGMDHDGPVARGRTLAGRRALGQGADIGPLVGIGGHGLFDGPGALVESGRWRWCRNARRQVSRAKAPMAFWAVWEKIRPVPAS